MVDRRQRSAACLLRATMFRRKSNPTMPTSSATKMAAAPLNVTVDDAGTPPPARLDLSGGSCGCGRFTSELRHPAFAATEVNGPTLHGPATFAPSGRWILLAKTVITLWSTSPLISGLLETDPMVRMLHPCPESKPYTLNHKP